MVKIKIEDIIFFIFLLIIIGTALWLLSGSPPLMNAIISIGLAIFGSELVLWKKIFSLENNFNSKLLKMDKSISIGFMTVKHDMDKLRIDINNRFDNLESKLNTIMRK